MVILYFKKWDSVAEIQNLVKVKLSLDEMNF